MDIRSYVRSFVSRPASGSTQNQFAVLAFDLGLPPGQGHPPANGPASPSDRITANSGSGPWTVVPHNWSPVDQARQGPGGAVVVKVDRAGNDDVYPESYGRRETIHSERSLMARLDTYIDHYRSVHRRDPTSISLYTFFSPCQSCISFLSRFPRGRSTPLWYLAYEQPYVRTGGAKTGADTEPFDTPEEAIVAVEPLRTTGWDVL